MRVKKGVHALKRRRNLPKAAKGFRHGRSKKEHLAKTAVIKSLVYARAHRRDKKADFRTLWNQKINAATRAEGVSYSKFINMLKVKGVMLDRKILAGLAQNEPRTFSKVLAFVKV